LSVSTWLAAIGSGPAAQPALQVFATSRRGCQSIRVQVVPLQRMITALGGEAAVALPRADPTAGGHGCHPGLVDPAWRTRAAHPAARRCA